MTRPTDADEYVWITTVIEDISPEYFKANFERHRGGFVMVYWAKPAGGGRNEKHSIYCDKWIPGNYVFKP